MTFLIFLLIFTAPMDLVAQEAFIFKLKGKDVVFLMNKEKFLIDENCFKIGPARCKALAITKKIKLDETYVAGGPNPGALICDKIMNAETIVGTMTNGAQNGFCHFDDDSSIALSSLYLAAKTNSRKKREF